MSTTKQILSAIEDTHNAALRALKEGLPPDDVEAITQATSAAITSLNTIYRISVDAIECPGCQMDLLDALRLHLLNCIGTTEDDMAIVAEENDFDQPEMILETETALLH